MLRVAVGIVSESREEEVTGGVSSQVLEEKRISKLRGKTTNRSMLAETCGAKCRVLIVSQALPS